MKEYLTVLEKCPLFDGLTGEEILTMLHCLNARKRSVEKDALLFREGDPADTAGVVLSGAVRVLREDYFGNRTVLGQLEPGELFGETFACAGVNALPVSVAAVQPSEVLLLDVRRVLTVCSHACTFHSRLIRNLVQAVAQKNLFLNQKLDITGRRTTREKLMAYLLRQAKEAGSPRFTIPFDRQALADYLGVERSAMSAELSAMQKEGILKTQRSRFELL